METPSQTGIFRRKAEARASAVTLSATSGRAHGCGPAPPLYRALEATSTRLVWAV